MATSLNLSAQGVEIGNWNTTCLSEVLSQSFESSPKLFSLDNEPNIFFVIQLKEFTGCTYGEYLFLTNTDPVCRVIN